MNRVGLTQPLNVCSVLIRAFSATENEALLASSRDQKTRMVRCLGAARGSYRRDSGPRSGVALTYCASHTGYVFWGHSPPQRKALEAAIDVLGFAVAYCLVKWFVKRRINRIEGRGCMTAGPDAGCPGATHLVAGDRAVRAALNLARVFAVGVGPAALHPHTWIGPCRCYCTA